MPENKKQVRGRPSEAEPLPFAVKLLVGILLFGLLLPALALMGLYFPPTQEFLLKRVVLLIEKRADIQIQMSSFQWRPLSELKLTGLSVHSDQTTLLTCNEARLIYRIRPKWPFLHPEEIRMEGPAIFLEKDNQGHWRIPTQRSTGEASESKEKSLEWLNALQMRIQVVSGTVTGRQDGQTVLSVRDVSGTLLIEPAEGGGAPRVTINFGPWQGCAEIPDLGDWTLSCEAGVDGRTLDVSGCRISTMRGAEVLARGRWSLEKPHDGWMEIEIMGFSGQTLPVSVGSLPLPSVSHGLLDLEKIGTSWFGTYLLATDAGTLEGSISFEGATPNNPLLVLRTHFADLQIPSGPGRPLFNLSGQMELIVLGNRIKDMRAYLGVAFEPSHWGKELIESGTLSGVYDAGEIALRAPNLATSLGTVEFDSHLDLRGWWDQQHHGRMGLALNVREGKLDRLVPGSFRKISAAASFEGSYGPGAIGRPQQWQGRIETHLNWPRVLSFKAAGSYGNEILNLDYEGEVSNLQGIADLLPHWSGSGKMSSRGSFKGKWPDIVWEGIATAPSLQYGALQVEQATVKGKTKLARWDDVRQLTLTVQNLIFQGKRLGRINLEMDQAADNSRFSLASEGLLGQGGLKVTGRVENLSAPIKTLSIHQGLLKWRDLSATLNARAEIGKQGLRIQSLALQRGKERLQVTGNALWDDQTDLKLSFESIEAGIWLQTFFPDLQLKGMVSGQATLAGRVDQPEASISAQLLNGTLTATLPKTGPSSRRSPERDSRELRIDRLQVQGSYAKETLSIKGDLQSPMIQVPAVFTARVPLRLSIKPPAAQWNSSGDTSLRLKFGGLQAAAATPFLPFLRKAEGVLDGEIEASGPLGLLQVRGAGSWRDGYLGFQEWPHALEAIQVNWRVDSKQLYVDSGTLQFWGGQVTIKGRAGYPEFQDVELTASGSNVDVKQFYGIRGKVAGEARLVSGRGNHEITGDLHLSGAEMDLSQFETDLARNIHIIDGEGKGDVVKIAGVRSHQSKFVRQLTMKLEIALPESGTWVRGKGLDAEIMGALRIEKAPQGPLRFYGRLQTLRGEYTVQNRKLKITEGELVFPGSLEPEPQLKILSQKDTRDALIEVRVTGPLKQPKLSLSSIPSMNQVDILSYLIFDRAAGDLSSRESFQLQDRAASWLGSEASRALKEVFGESPLTPDTLRYRTTTGRPVGSTGAGSERGVVEVGKYITPDLYVHFEKGVTGEEGNELKVEYRVNRNLSIQTQFGGTEQSGVDVFWRYEFGD